MAINRIECPECGAGLKSASGFEEGQSVDCPKCESSFTVEVPEEDETPTKKPVKAVSSRTDDDDDAPTKKKKKRRRDDDEDDDDGKKKSYKNSPMRFAVLGILVVVMGVLGFMLYQKRKSDKEAEDHNAKVNAENNANFVPGQNPNEGFKQFTPPPLVGAGGGGLPKKNPGGGVQPPQFPGGGMQPPKLPGGGPNPPFVLPAGGPAGGNGLLADTPWEGSPESKKRIADLRQKLVGTWHGAGPDGAMHVVTYQANGQFTHTVNGQATNGKWDVTKLVGGKVLRLSRGTANLKVAFEGDDLLHDTETPGVSVVLKKK